MKRAIEVIREIKEKISQFERLSFDKFQSFEWFKSVKVGETITFDNGVVSTKVLSQEDSYTFSVFIPPFTEFPEHWHDCTEIIKVASGKLYDKILGYEVSKNQDVEIQKMQPHQPYTKEESATILIVEFKK